VRRVLEAIDAASEWTGKISAFLIPGMMFIMTYEVVARYILKSPTIWAMESTQYLFLATTALGGAYVLRHGGHVNVPILYSRLSTRTQAIVDVVTSKFKKGGKSRMRHLLVSPSYSLLCQILSHQLDNLLRSWASGGCLVQNGGCSFQDLRILLIR